jgi:hypothetical protein
MDHDEEVLQYNERVAKRTPKEQQDAEHNPARANQHRPLLLRPHLHYLLEQFQSRLTTRSALLRDRKVRSFFFCFYYPFFCFFFP